MRYKCEGFGKREKRQNLFGVINEEFHRSNKTITVPKIDHIGTNFGVMKIMRRCISVSNSLIKKLSIFLLNHTTLL